MAGFISTYPARWRYFVAAVILGMLAPMAQADSGQHDILLLPSVGFLDTFDESSSVVEESFTHLGIDAIYSYTGGRFRFVGEYLLASTESELERLQFGWRAGANTTWWFGRFHTTSKFWTTEFHHGQYMQTSITRPSIEEWEDESGPTPSHITGVTMEHRSPGSGQAEWEMAFSFGLAPTFVKDGMKPFDLLEPDSDHGLSFHGRVAYRPDLFGDNQVGVVLGWNDINVDSESSPDLAGLNDIQQVAVGIFADWRWADLRVIGSAVHFEHDLRYTGDLVKDEFITAYLQPEFRLSQKWTVFGRVDYSTEEDKSPYLRLLPAYVAHRHMLGLRWDFVEKQALTVEVADTSAQGENFMHNTFKEIRFQWSAVFP